jgi:hypothetical protein
MIRPDIQLFEKKSKKIFLGAKSPSASAAK